MRVDEPHAEGALQPGVEGGADCENGQGLHVSGLASFSFEQNEILISKSKSSALGNSYLDALDLVCVMFTPLERKNRCSVDSVGAMRKKTATL